VAETAWAFAEVAVARVAASAARQTVKRILENPHFIGIEDCKDALRVSKQVENTGFVRF
jgi:hypothetical protein